MSAQDRTEDALRAMHILIANAEFEPGSNSKIIIDKDEAQSLLKELGDCLYAMLDESELTKSSRQQAERRTVAIYRFTFMVLWICACLFDCKDTKKK